MFIVHAVSVLFCLFVGLIVTVLWRCHLPLVDNRKIVDGD